MKTVNVLRRGTLNPSARIARLSAYWAVVAMTACFAMPVSTQELTDLEVLKKQIKQELLTELRKETASPQKPDSELEKLKEEIKREILKELHATQPSHDQTPSARKDELKKELRFEILQEFQKQRPAYHPQSVKLANSAYGDAQGVLLRNGVGLAGCQVKLVSFNTKAPFLFSHSQDKQYITITDAWGRYRFEKIPTGNYKVKWRPRGEDGWIRRLWDRPDVTIDAGTVSTLKPVETAKPLVPK